ncbi:MAG: flagellar basal body protein, partial [Pseudomonadota bacterium]
MGLSTALSAAVSGLTAAQTRATTVANNIANANTDGYVRRTTNVNERIVGGQGVGVDVTSIGRQTANFLTSERMRFGAENAFSSEQATSASRIADLLGDPGIQDGLFGAYARFENSLRDAAATPESSVLQREVVDNANDIVRQFQTLSEQSARLRTQADTDIGRAVTEVNDALQRLEELNGIGGESLTPDVLDERQRLVDRINDIIPVRAQNVGDSLNLSTEGGVVLLAQDAQLIEFSPAVLVTRNQSLGNGLSGLTVAGTDITPTGSGSQAVQGGRIAALFETRDERLPAFNDSIDALAADLVIRFADDSVDPSKPAGEVGLFTAGAPTLPAPAPGGVVDYN